MTSLAEICDILGRSWSGLESTGRPKFILKNLEEFSRNWTGIKDKKLLGKFFLDHYGKKLFSHAECSPKLPDHRDEILGLVTQALRLLHAAKPAGDIKQNLPSQNSDSTVTTRPNISVTATIDEKSSENSTGMIDEEPTVKTEEKSDNQLSGMAVESSTSAPPSPMIHSSKIELVRLLKDWITSHPNIRIPALARYDKNSLENSFAMEASLVGTNERIWIIRLGVIDMYQGWVLKKADGSIILVKAHYRKGGYVYYGWLGNDIGYSDEVIAHHKDVPRLVLTLRLYARKRNLDAEDVLNEYDISEDALEPENPTPKPTIPAAGRANKDGQESDTTLSSPPSDSDSSPVFSRASRKRPSGQDIAMKPKKSAKMTFSETSSPTPPISPCAIHNLTSIDDPQVRGKIKRLHKIFPTMTVAVCESVLYKNKGNVDHAIDDLYGLQNIPSSTDATFSDAGPPAASTRSRRTKLTARQDKLRTPSPARRKSSNTTQLATPFSTDQSPSSLGYPTPQTPCLRAPRNPITTINFFLSNPTLGAVPIPFATIKSKNKFFTEAISAHFLTSASISHDDNESVVAASVAVPGLTHPIVVRRKNGNPAWEEVGRVVREVEGLRGGVEVEVRCVLQPVVPVPRKGRSYGR